MRRPEHPSKHGLYVTYNPGLTVRPSYIVPSVLETLTDAIRAEIEHATEVVATRTARAARGGALLGGAIGGVLFGIVLALGIIIGRIGS